MIPDRISQWLLHIKEAAAAHGIYWATMAAICDRESNGGDAATPKGPAGTGDFKPRGGNYYASRPDCIEVAAGATSAHFMPADGHGWGRGLFQIDFGAHPELVAKKLSSSEPAWTDPLENSVMAAGLLQHAATRFDGDELMMIAAFNAGEGAVHHCVDQLTKPVEDGVKLKALDAITTGGDYVSDVLRRRAEFLQPEGEKIL